MTKPATTAPAPTPAKEKGLEVRTTGDFMLIDMISGVEFEPRVTTPTERTAFVDRRIKLGDLEIVK